MSSRRFSIVTGLLVLILVTGASRVVMAADKGFFKGIERFYGDTDGKRLFMEGANLEYFQVRPTCGLKQRRFGKRLMARGRSSFGRRFF